MLKNILGVIAGFFAGGLFVTIFEWLGHQLYPVPATVDPGNLSSVAEYIRSAPLGALLSVLLAQSMGSFVGGLVTGWMTGRKRGAILIYGLLALFMAGLNAFLVPHPTWFVIISLVLPFPLALLGSNCSNFTRTSKNGNSN